MFVYTYSLIMGLVKKIVNYYLSRVYIVDGIDSALIVCCEALSVFAPTFATTDFYCLCHIMKISRCWFIDSNCLWC